MDSDLEVARARLGRRMGDRWLLERVLGTGGMGAVYAARGPDGAVAAVKILHPEMGARREVRERFLREGTAADSIGHPGVVRVLGQGDGPEAFLVLELLEGETLRARVRRHGRLPLAELLDFSEQILDVLGAAHARGVIHRDLKPDNLWVTLENRIKVLDFGLARVLDEVPGRHQTRTGVALGTLAYMAPEQALGRRHEIDGRVDLFALGATMFRVLAGRSVHEAESEAELLMAMASRPAPPLAAVVPDVRAGVALVVDLALAFSRDARYPDARTMQGDVHALRHGESPPYATARLASRDAHTRPDNSGPTAPATQPLGAAPVSTQPLARVQSAPPVPAAVPVLTQPLGMLKAPTPLPGAAPLATQPLDAAQPFDAMQPFGAMPAPASVRTIPLAAYNAPATPYASAGVGTAPSAPPPGAAHDISPPERAPLSNRTELLAVVPNPSAPPAVTPHVAPPRSVPPTLSDAPLFSAPPVAAWPSSPAPSQRPSRAGLVVLIALGVFGVVGVGVLVAYRALSSSPESATAAIATDALPSPTASGATSARRPLVAPPVSEASSAGPVTSPFGVTSVTAPAAAASAPPRVTTPGRVGHRHTHAH